MTPAPIVIAEVDSVLPAGPGAPSTRWTHGTSAGTTSAVGLQFCRRFVRLRKRGHGRRGPGLSSVVAMRMKAVFNGIVLAESDDTKVVEGNHYFPPESINREYFAESSTRTRHWKGTASYYTIDVDGVRSADAAWYYPTPSTQAKEIKDHVAFWNVAEVTPAG
jgi:uncharacterized protein (DUF427 family)